MSSLRKRVVVSRVEDGIDFATLVFPIRSPRGLFRRTALRKKVDNQLLCFHSLCLQINLRHGD